MTTPAHAQQKEKSTGLPRQPEQSAAFPMSSQLLPLVCETASIVPPCRGSTVQMLGLHHHASVLIVAPSRGLQKPLPSSSRWHTCAKLADTRFAWWQPTHPRTSYHKLEGLSPGWVREWRCICVYVWRFSSVARQDSQTQRPALLKMNAYGSGTMHEDAIEASEKF